MFEVEEPPLRSEHRYRGHPLSEFTTIQQHMKKLTNYISGHKPDVCDDDTGLANSK
jgi:hypothetical protein